MKLRIVSEKCDTITQIHTNKNAVNKYQKKFLISDSKKAWISQTGSLWIRALIPDGNAHT